MHALELDTGRKSEIRSTFFAVYEMQQAQCLSDSDIGRPAHVMALDQEINAPAEYAEPWRIAEKIQCVR